MRLRSHRGGQRMQGPAASGKWLLLHQGHCGARKRGTEKLRAFTAGAWVPGKSLQPKEELKDQMVHWGQGPVTSEALVGT